MFEYNKFKKLGIWSSSSRAFWRVGINYMYRKNHKWIKKGGLKLPFVW